MSSQTILYDLPSRQGTAWSLNPWKTRLVLNYKKIDYKTEWVEYPDLAPTFKSFGIQPNDPNSPGYYAEYSSPAVKLADGTYMMDSWPIAHELEKRYPSPSLHLDEPIVMQVRDHIPEIMKPLMGFTITQVPVVLLSKRSADYFYETRKTRFGKSLEELREEMATQENWDAAKAPAKQMGDWLRKNGGPFFLGETVSYADFIFLGVMAMLKRIDEDLFQRFLAFDTAFPILYQASTQWLEKDD